MNNVLFQQSTFDTGRLTQVTEYIEFIHLQTSWPEHSYYCVREREREQSELMWSL